MPPTLHALLALLLLLTAGYSAVPLGMHYVESQSSMKGAQMAMKEGATILKPTKAINIGDDDSDVQQPPVPVYVPPRFTPFYSLQNEAEQLGLYTAVENVSSVRTFGTLGQLLSNRYGISLNDSVIVSAEVSYKPTESYRILLKSTKGVTYKLTAARKSDNSTEITYLDQISPKYSAAAQDRQLFITADVLIRALYAQILEKAVISNSTQNLQTDMVNYQVEYSDGANSYLANSSVSLKNSPTVKIKSLSSTLPVRIPLKFNSLTDDLSYLDANLQEIDNKVKSSLAGKLGFYPTSQTNIFKVMVAVGWDINTLYYSYFYDNNSTYTEVAATYQLSQSNIEVIYLKTFTLKLKPQDRFNQVSLVAVWGLQSFSQAISDAELRYPELRRNRYLINKIQIQQNNQIVYRITFFIPSTGGSVVSVYS